MHKRANIGTDIIKAVKLLKEDEIVAIPTETVYGLAANALHEDAVLKIFKAKKRPFFDPLIIHIPAPEAITKYVKTVPENAKKLMQHFWPGPLTLVLPKKDIIPDLVTSGHPTVAVRMPDHPLTLQLLSQLDFPLAAPSANPFGYVSPTTAKHVYDQLSNELDYILDGGACKIGLESTIIGFRGEEPQILRLGGIPVEEIEKIAGKISLQLNQASKPDAPGQLSSHYAPTKPLFFGNIEDLLRKYPNKKIGIISFTKDYKTNFPSSVSTQWILSPSTDLNEAAKNLFHVLRETDSADVELILAEKMPETGLGRAINDRLLRASVR